MAVQNRYEFRVWAPSLATLKKKLEALARPDGPRTSTEIYLLSTATDNCNAKIRAEIIEVKILVKREGKLQQWAPVLKKHFPLATCVIVKQLFPLLALTAVSLPKRTYKLKDFLEAIRTADGMIGVAIVNKERLQFDLGQCEAEFAHVTIGDIARDTVAVEAVDPNAVLTAMRSLEIDNLPNCSYVRQIKLLLGMPKR